MFNVEFEKVSFLELENRMVYIRDKGRQFGEQFVVDLAMDS